MPARKIVAKELAALLGVLSHPARLQLVEELGQGERDVNALTAALGIAQSGVSQHLALLRAHRVVAERREGRHVYYRLRRPDLAAWLAAGLDFIGGPADDLVDMPDMVRAARAIWTGDGPDA